MIQELKEFGLSEYEIKTYVTLLQHGSSTGSEISKKSEVPQGKVYWALHRLAEKGFVTITDIKPQRFHATKPEIVLSKLIEEKKEKLAEFKDSTIKKISELQKPLKEDKIVEKIQVLSGKKARDSLFYHFLENAKKEVKYIFTYEERSYSIHNAFQTAIHRGVKVKLITTMIDKNSMKLIKEDMAIGVEIKYLKVEEMRLQTMDDTEARITVINPKDRRDRTTIYFESSGMAKHLGAYCDSLWMKAEKIES